MLKQVLDFILGRKGAPAPEPVAPYKVEAPEPVVLSPVVVEATAPKAPEPAKCGCGRSPTGFCVGLHKLSESEWATHKDNPNKATEKKPAVKAKTARTKKAPAAAMTAAEKPKKAPAKKPRAKKEAK